MRCKWHTCNNKLEGKQTSFCSLKCKNKFFVDRRRKELKRKAIDYLGGECVCCGYNKCISALDFHHKDPSQKDFGISASGTTKSWKRMEEELNKCILVCNRCHSEIHAGITIPPYPTGKGTDC